MNKTNQAGWAVAVFIAVSVALLFATGAIRFGGAHEQAKDEHAGHGHGDSLLDVDEDDHGEAEEEQDGCGGCGESELASDDHHEEDGQDEHSEDEEDGCGGCGADTQDDEALAAAAARHCEHDVAIVDCSACRYELGVVKLLPHVEGLTSTSTVRQVMSGNSLRLTGEVRLDQRRVAHLPAVAGGIISRVTRFQGDKVNKGDVLAVLRSTELGEYQARRLESEAAVKLARSRYRRQEALREKGVNSEADLLEAEAALKAAEAEQLVATRRLELFGLSPESQTAEGKSIGELTIEAPSDGVVLEQNAVAGQAIKGGENLFVIADLNVVWVWAALYERDLPALKDELAHGHDVHCRVSVGGATPIQFDGVVETLGGQVDSRSRTVPVRIRVKNPNQYLQPGMFVDVEIPSGHDEHACLVVPTGAVLRDEGDHFVFKHWRDDLWVRRFVTPGAPHTEGVTILEGLAAGDTVIAGGSFMLKSDVLREKMGAGCAH